MNILNKLRRQSTDDEFLVRLTRKDARELLEFAHNDYLDKESIAMWQSYFNEAGGFKNSYGEKITRLIPTRIDYNNQMLITSTAMLHVFVHSTVEFIDIKIRFVKSKPITDRD